MSAPERVRLSLSALPKCWLLDFDGCIVRHNGYLDGGDVLLPGVAEFWRSIPATDHVVILSARPEEERQAVTEFLAAHGLQVHQVVLGLPVGERICVNDVKPSGLRTAVAVNLPRDAGLGLLTHTLDPTK